MPLYLLYCEKCYCPFEVTMTLEVNDKFDAGEISKDCPVCDEKLKKIICAPKTIRVN